MKNCITSLLVFFSVLAYAYSQEESVGLRWSTSVAKGGFNYVNDMSVDKDGNVYVAGSTGYKSDLERHDMLIVKIDPKGTHVWMDTVQGDAQLRDVAYDIEIDKNGDIYLAGGSVEIPPQPGSI